MTFQPDITLDAVTLIIGLAVLGVAAHYTIRSVTGVARATGVSETSIGFLLLAFATSIPELSVTVISSSGGAVDLAVGNILGSNAANIGLVIGVPFLILGLSGAKGRKVNLSSMSSREFEDIFFGLLIAAMIPLFFLAWSFSIQVLGGILVVAYLLVAYRLLRRGRGQEFHHEGGSKGTRRTLVKDSAVLAIGLVGVIGSSNYIVDSGVAIASLTGVSGAVIGALVVAVGTSLPELAISLSAAISRRGGLALGNAVGSCFTNVTIIFGILFLIAPVSIAPLGFLPQIVFSVLLIVVLWFFLQARQLKVWQAGSLLVLYVFFVLSSLGVAFTI